MDVVFRAAAVWLFLLLFTRGMGKRELTELTSFELIVLVTMGDLVQQGVTQEDFSVTGSILAVCTFGLLSVVASWLAFRFRRVRPVLEGSPVLVVRDGKPLDDVLRYERLTLDEVKEAARGQGIKDLAEVSVGVLEPDGKMSFLTTDGDRHEEPEKHAG